MIGGRSVSLKGIEKALGVGGQGVAALAGELEGGEGFAVVDGFLDGNEAGGLEASGVGGEVAIGQAGLMTQAHERLPRLGGEGGEDAKAADAGDEGIEGHIGIIGRWGVK